MLSRVLQNSPAVLVSSLQHPQRKVVLQNEVEAIFEGIAVNHEIRIWLNPKNSPHLRYEVSSVVKREILVNLLWNFCISVHLRHIQILDELFLVFLHVHIVDQRFQFIESFASIVEDRLLHQIQKSHFLISTTFLQLDFYSVLLESFRIDSEEFVNVVHAQ